MNNIITILINKFSFAAMSPLCSPLPVTNPQIGWCLGSNFWDSYFAGWDSNFWDQICVTLKIENRVRRSTS